MNDMKLIGSKIKSRRLSLNLRMDDVAKEAGITRATLSSIENGSGNCAFNTILKLFNILDISFLLEAINDNVSRHRATRCNTLLNKNINRFIVMTVEQYAKKSNRPGYLVYKEMREMGVIDELKNDYEDLHGMSTMYLNEYIDALLRRNNA